jgi:Predicted transcriptional regulator
MGDELKEVAEVFQAVSSENRLKIIKELSTGPKTWSELMFSLKMNPKILDESLKKLIQAGVIVKEGNKYRLTSIGDYILQIIEPLAKLTADIIESLFKSFSLKKKK